MPGEPVKVGERVGFYNVEGVIGGGGVGVVYRARHQLFQRVVALKVLSAHYARDAELVSRFLSEASATSRIEHPNVVKVFEVIDDRESGRVAYAMELLSGPTLLKALAKRGRYDLDETVNCARQLASALEAMHARHIVHRDLKPANIMMIGAIEDDPCAKIVDFGIAQVAPPPAGDARRSRSDTPQPPLGTFTYMAPEQITGDGIGPPADLYALAEIVFEMLSGRPVFTPNSTESVEQKRKGKVPELELPADVPNGDAVRRLVKRCLAGDPEARPSVAELSGELAELIRPGRRSTLSRIREWLGR